MILAALAVVFAGPLYALVSHILTDAAGPLVCARCGRPVGRAGCPCRFGRAVRGCL